MDSSAESSTLGKPLSSDDIRSSVMGSVQVSSQGLSISFLYLERDIDCQNVFLPPSQALMMVIKGFGL